MKKSLSLMSISLASLVTAHAQAQTAPAAPEATLTPKVSLYSEYEYRGIAQTAEKPALQFNLDYAHPSGFYLGTFVTNIKWLKEAAKAGNFSTDANIEWDIFGGYKFEIAKDVTLDIGYLRYEYPSSGAFNPSPNTDEIYIGVASGAFSAKYSHSTSNLFGFGNSKGSGFTEINWSQEIMPKLVANAQVARQTVKNNGDFSYTVYKLGATYDLGDGWAAGGYLKDTNAKTAFYTVNGKDLGKARLVAFIAKSF
ncbi:MAG: hypothetical protein JNK75_12685 [Betaproteobacteria bacterium]|nr:hypothetical protein [Betaproteobacteria bacterium]